MTKVIAIIHGEDGTFGISYPDFPGVISGGKTPDEALARGRQTLAFHVEGMIEDGEALPVLKSLSELQSGEAFREDAKDGIVVLTEFDLPSKPVRVNISIDKALLNAVDRAAEMSGQTRSAFLAESARARIIKAA